MARYCPQERYSYLQELLAEFQDTSSIDAKQQVLANLGNFAYDPQNFGHFKQLNIVSLFLDQLNGNDDNLTEFAMSGLCNLSLDKDLKETILRRGGVDKVIRCLSSNCEETVLSAVTTLMFLITPQSKLEITTPSVIDCMLRFKTSNNRRLSNLAAVFLQDYCTLSQVQDAQRLAEEHKQQNNVQFVQSTENAV